jgi:hypothetical protein
MNTVNTTKLLHTHHENCQSRTATHILRKQSPEIGFGIGLFFIVFEALDK